MKAESIEQYGCWEKVRMLRTNFYQCCMGVLRVNKSKCLNRISVILVILQQGLSKVVS